MDIAMFIKLAKRELLTEKDKARIAVWAPAVGQAAMRASLAYSKVEGRPQVRTAAAARAAVLGAGVSDVQGVLSRRSSQIVHQQSHKAKVLAQAAARDSQEKLRQLYQRGKDLSWEDAI